MVMEAHKGDWRASPSLEDIIAVDSWSRDQVDSALAKANSELVYIN
jgi:hypothetical protein